MTHGAWLIPWRWPPTTARPPRLVPTNLGRPTGKSSCRRPAGVIDARHLVAFAEPILDLRTDEANADEYHHVLSLAAVLWNALVLAELDQPDADELVNEVLGRFRASAVDCGIPSDFAEALLEELIERKRRLFADDRRFIAGVDVEVRDDMINVIALSRFT